MIYTRATSPFSPTPDAYKKLESFLSSPRIGRYLAESSGNTSLAFRLYRWNIQLCESFYLPSQFVEIGFRNTVVRAMDSRFGVSWPLLYNSTHLSALPSGARDKIKDAAASAMRNNKPLLADRVIAALDFGFWCKMLDKRYDQLLWTSGMQAHFLNLPPNMTRHDVRKRFLGLKDFRNRIAHHEPIFHVYPRQQIQRMLEVVEWMCADTATLVKAMSDVETVLSSKPTA